jgi:hypothetical protein
MRARVGETIVGGVGAILRFAHCGAWLGGLNLLFALPVAWGLVAAVNRPVGSSLLGRQLAETGSAERLGEIFVHLRHPLAAALAPLAVLVPLATLVGLLLGTGLLARMIAGTPRPALAGMVEEGLRHLRRTLGILAFLAIAAAILMGGAVALLAPLAKMLAPRLMDDRLAFAYALLCGGIGFAILAWLRGAWSLARIEAIRGDVRPLSATLRGLALAVRRPGLTLAVELLFGLLPFVPPLLAIGMVALLPAAGAPGVVLDLILLAAGWFFSGWLRIGRLGAWVRASSNGAETPAETTEGAGEEPESPAPPPAAEPALFDLPVTEARQEGSFPRAELGETDRPSADEPLPAAVSLQSPRARPSKEITIPLPVDVLRAAAKERIFPANLPRGLGLEVIATSKQGGGPQLPQGWVPGDPLGAAGNEAPLPDPGKEEPTVPIPADQIRKRLSTSAQAAAVTRAALEQAEVIPSKPGGNGSPVELLGEPESETEPERGDGAGDPLPEGVDDSGPTPPLPSAPTIEAPPPEGETGSDADPLPSTTDPVDPASR